MGNEAGKVVQFPGKRENVSPKTHCQIQNIDGIKYFNQQQIKLLRRTARDKAAVKIKEKRKDEQGNETKVVVEEIPFECEPLLTPSRWDELQQRLTDGRRKRSGRPLTGADKFILRDLLQCGVCGKKIVPRHHVQTNGKVTLNYACYWKAIHQRKLDEYGRERCLLPHIPAHDLDKNVYAYIITKIIHHEDPEQETPLTALVDTDLIEDKIKEHESHLETLKDQLARKLRGLKATRKAKEEPSFSDFANYNAEVTGYLKEIKEIKQRMAEVDENIQKIQQVKIDQELFAEIARSEQVNEICDRLWELSNEDRHRLLEGLLDGPIVVTPPSGEAKMYPEINSELIRWVKFKLRPNITILQAILGACRRNSTDSHSMVICSHYGKDIQILRQKTNAAAPALTSGLAPRGTSGPLHFGRGRAA